MSNHPRWAPLPPLDGATRAEWREYRAKVRRVKVEIGFIWDMIFSGMHVLIGTSSPAGLLTWDDPPIQGPITMGPPTRWSVKPRQGQQLDDFVALAPRIATAYEVDAVEVTGFVPGWLRLVLVERPEDADFAPPTAIAPQQPGELGPGTSTADAADRFRPHGRPLGRRGWRRPFGGPRTQR